MVLQSGKKKSDFRINISRKEKKIMKMKRMAAAMLAAMMTVSLAACGQSGDNTKEASKKQTKETTKKTERQEADPEEDWEEMQKETATGTEANDLFKGGACEAAKCGSGLWSCSPASPSPGGS